jgi:hypothetical protein
MCHTWRCPGCGAVVGLPAAAPAPTDIPAEKRLDQLAQASCGCWVDVLSERRMARLLEAIVGLDDEFARPIRVVSARRF